MSDEVWQGFAKGRYRVRGAVDAADVAAALDLRSRVFRGGSAPDRDAHDDLCRHVLVEVAATGDLVAAYRLTLLPDGGALTRSYAAQFYDLTPLATFDEPMLELGRFCIAPGARDPDILRVAWAAMTRLVDGQGVGMLFGCSSFPGSDPALHTDALALLARRHLAPARWRPKPRAAETFPFARSLADRRPDLKAAQAAMPPLLRTYLLMGGWVSDHAVIDRDLGTVHVFTALEIGAVPAGRAALFRGMAV